MNREQYLNKARDMAKKDFSFMEFFDKYPPRNAQVSTELLSKKLVKFFKGTTESEIQLYLNVADNLKK